MLDEWNSQLTEATEQPGGGAGLGAGAAAAAGPGSSGSSPDLFGLDHRAKYISRREGSVAAPIMLRRPSTALPRLLLRPLLVSSHSARSRTRRGRGHAVAFTVANDQLFVATSRGFLLRHDLSAGGDGAEAGAPTCRLLRAGCRRRCWPLRCCSSSC